MTFATHYNVGTVTVTAGSDAVAGVGTFWNGNVAPGDILWVAGVSCRILTVTGNTSLTLARPWPGATVAAAYYEAWAVLDAVGYQKKTGELLTKLAGGNLDAFAGLAGAADRLGYFDGAGTMALTPLTAFARSLLDDANPAAFWGTIGATSPANAAFRRANALGTVSQSAGVPTGALMEDGSNANGEYVRFANGLQICWRGGTTLTAASANAAAFTWTLPASFSGGVPAFSGIVRSGSGGDYSGITSVNVGAHYAGVSGTTSVMNMGFFASFSAAFTVGGTISNCILWTIGRWF